MGMFATFMREGGVFMYLILVVSMMGTAIAVERIICLFFKYSADADMLWKKISKAIADNNIESAKSFCRGGAAPIARVFDKALQNCGKSERELQTAVDEVSLEVIPDIDKRVSYLAMLANIATLLGLLGTIQGLIQAFQAVGSADPTQKASILAGGISIALYTTAFGLVVAIPILIAYSILQSKAHRLVDDIDEFSIKIINLLSKSIGDRRGNVS